MDIKKLLSALPTYNDKPQNNKNIPYPHLQIISGKTGSGKTYLLFQQLLTPNFLDYDELYVLSPNINVKEYQFLKLGFQHNLSKSAMLHLFSILDKFRTKDLNDIIEYYKHELPEHETNNYIKALFTNKQNDLPTISEMDEVKQK